LKEKKREKWQRIGRFGLNRWGRENALAAGLALYLGITDKVILSGGRTIPEWYKNILREKFIAQNPDILQDEVESHFQQWLNTYWPSEAELMKDIIVQRFGKMYQDRYGKSIEEAILIENESTNTLLNFANSINKNPDLLNQNKKIGFLATDFHMRRTLFLAKLFSLIDLPVEEIASEAKRILAQLTNVFVIDDENEPAIKSQTILKKRAEIRGKQTYIKIQDWLLNLDENPDLQARVKGEQRWTKGLTDPQFLAYYACYFGEFNKQEVLKPLQKFLKLLSQPEWLEQARKIFNQHGLNFDEFSEIDINENPEKLEKLIQALKSIKRIMPPEN